MQSAMQQAASVASDRIRAGLRAEESLRVAVLLSIAGGFLDAFTWIAPHGVMANAQTANVVLLAVYVALGEWDQAFRHIPPIAAFALGVFVICHLRVGADDRGRYWLAITTLMIEATVLFIVMVLHVRLPDVAGTVGISFAAAMQTASFNRVEGRPYSSVMVTGNLRSSVETFFTGWLEKRDPASLRQTRLLVIVCATFALGAALGAFLTKLMESRALLVPIALLLAALFLCRPAQDR